MEAIRRVLAAVNSVVRGKEEVVRAAFACLLARGHLLIEDAPGLGKTTLAIALARATGLTFARIQFTSDLLPADIIGATVIDRKTGEFVFKKGPIFHQVILADEINRATPKTQSALLEAMGEGQVTVDGITIPLPRPFFVIATQNPADHYGTFPLPDSQLDRFLFRIRMGYPDRRAEREILRHGHYREDAVQLPSAITPEQLLKLQEQAERVYVDEKVIDYILDIGWATRKTRELVQGLSTRGLLALLRAARAWALIEGRDFVTPDDVKAAAPYALGHRLQTLSGTGSLPAEHILREILERLPVPL